VPENLSLIDNEIAEMCCDVRIIDRESRHIYICLIRDCAGRERVIIGLQDCRRHWQHQKLYKNCQLES
ncbi:hypothetical protein BDDG_13162, partial [Blastomyces dermatitidis ATCC 18188]